MHFITSCWIIVTSKLLFITAKHNWKYDVVSVYSNTSNADIFDLDVKLDRISRGVFGLSGFMDIKQDVYDVVANVRVYRSSTGYENDYHLTPFTIDNENLQRLMNVHYKQHFMAIAKDCATNSPQFETFKAPVKKAKIEFRKCVIPIDDFPDYIPAGSYKFHVTVSIEDLVTGFIEGITSVENIYF